MNTKKYKKGKYVILHITDAVKTTIKIDENSHIVAA